MGGVSGRFCVARLTHLTVSLHKVDPGIQHTGADLHHGVGIRAGGTQVMISFTTFP